MKRLKVIKVGGNRLLAYRECSCFDFCKLNFINLLISETWDVNEKGKIIHFIPDVCSSGVTAPCIRNLGSKYGLASRSGYVILGERTSILTYGLDPTAKREILPPRGIKSRSFSW
ncbi:hypothetical protein L798_00750 [Zootermopsis nevadensis]|uniref:Uncharacterized protein n=1 Tax=Zootermopsis nevadensis TaxID=136037 RepID=A0A067QJD1_ZOONE|nr:hypothetical protein L798_00750 [Zootermopsis nevadensis]